MALNWNPNRQNIRQQIQQINFILNNPLNPVCKTFLTYWSREELDAKLNELVQLYRMTPSERAQQLAARPLFQKAA